MQVNFGAAKSWNDENGDFAGRVLGYFVEFSNYTGGMDSTYASDKTTVDLYNLDDGICDVLIPETTPNADIDYENEVITGLESGADYEINGEPHTADGNGEIAIDTAWLDDDIEIVKKGDGLTTDDSAAHTLPIPPPERTKSWQNE